MGTRKERYQIIHTIAESETKTIWLVYHPIEQVYYIMKRLPSSSNTKIYEQMMMHPHPYIPSIYETFIQEGHFYVVEAFINGPTLGYVMSAKIIHQSTAIRYVTQLCEVLNHLHTLSPPLIHRDIKAENILIFEDHIMLIDFEIAIQYSEEANKDTQVLGSVGYAAPEQYGFNQSDERTDIYAVGVLMNYLLSNKHPKDGIAQGQYEKVIQKCIAIDPKDRYQHVSLLYQAISKQNLPTVVEKHAYALPGFRNRNPYLWMTSLCLYALMIYLGWGITIKDPKPSQIYLILFKLSFVISLFSWVMIIGNYRGCHNRLPLCQYENKTIKYIGIVLNCILSAFFIILFFVIVNGICESLL